ncbi:amino acid transporter AVT1I-like [Vicia villosa]|uniref:amino acid transporter AVT1I-like n=1 Tax=Vicia villosa TaxID=3911 RepID=UPI00273B506F|nr:amino acid transporter AVT1I-like [Vicia villosa]
MAATLAANVPLLGDAITDEEKVIASDSSSKNEVSFFRSCLNLLNAVAGIGILSIPYALASGGWLSLPFLFSIAAIAFYTGLLMKRCMEKHSNIRTFPDMGELAFGKTGKLIVAISMYTEHYLLTIGFLILEGDNLSHLFPIEEFQVAGISIDAKQFFVILVALIVLPTICLDNLSLISYVSASGIFATTIIILSISWSATFDGVGVKQKGDLVNWNGISTAVSLYTVCYSAHPVFPIIYNSMKKKHQFSYVLIVCFMLATTAFALFAIIGYIMFGSKVESQVTLNLPLDKLSSRIAIYTTLVTPITKFAIVAMPITDALKKLLPKKFKNNRMTNIFLSTVLLTSSVFVTLALPFFGSLMSLVGAFLTVTASILLPCLCYLKISGIYRKFEFETIVIVVIILVAIVMGISGTYTSVVELVQESSNK